MQNEMDCRLEQRNQGRTGRCLHLPGWQMPTKPKRRRRKQNNNSSHRNSSMLRIAFEYYGTISNTVLLQNTFENSKFNLKQRKDVSSWNCFVFGQHYTNIISYRRMGGRENRIQIDNLSAAFEYFSNYCRHFEKYNRLQKSYFRQFLLWPPVKYVQINEV